MATIKVPTSFNIDVEFEIPEFYKRLVALLIDVLIEFFYFKIAIAIFVAIIKNSDLKNEDTLYDLHWASLLFLVPVLLYHLVLEITMNGQSVGKKIMSIRVVNENGGRASISQFMIRWLLRLSDFSIILLTLGGNGNLVMYLLLVGFLITDIVLAIASKKGQRIGDMLAHTILIKTNSKASIEETVFQEVADSYTPSFPQIMQLSDRDINAIKSILETSRKKGDYNMASAASEKIKSHLRIDSSLSPFDFLDMLLKDYNYLSTK